VNSVAYSQKFVQTTLSSVTQLFIAVLYVRLYVQCVQKKDQKTVVLNALRFSKSAVLQNSDALIQQSTVVKPATGCWKC